MYPDHVIRAGCGGKAGRRREDPLPPRQRLEQCSRAIWVELGEDIVEQQDRFRHTDGANYTIGREAKGKCERALLAL